MANKNSLVLKALTALTETENKHRCSNLGNIKNKYQKNLTNHILSAMMVVDSKKGGNDG